MTDRIEKHGLQVALELASFIEDRALPGTGIAPDAFWAGFAGLIAQMTPRNRALLEKREDLQARIDAWHIAHRDAPHDRRAYEAFLREITRVAVADSLNVRWTLSTRKLGGV